MADEDITSAILLEHMHGMEERLLERIGGVEKRIVAVEKGITGLKAELTEFREENKRDHEVIHEDIMDIGYDVYKQKHEITPHVEKRLLRLEDHAGLSPLPVPVAVE